MTPLQNLVCALLVAQRKGEDIQDRLAELIEKYGQPAVLCAIEFADVPVPTPAKWRAIRSGTRNKALERTRW